MAPSNNGSIDDFKVVGTRPVRHDGIDKVTGRAKYGADYALPGMLYGKVLRSPHAHARIRSIDTAKAEALPGVKAVVTAADMPEQPFDYAGPERVQLNFWHMTRNIFAREKALYDGHPVAAVAATTAALAQAALALIKVEYEVLPHVIDVVEAMQPGAPLARAAPGHARPPELAVDALLDQAELLHHLPPPLLRGAVPAFQQLQDLCQGCLQGMRQVAQ